MVYGRYRFASGDIYIYIKEYTLRRRWVRGGYVYIAFIFFYPRMRRELKKKKRYRIYFCCAIVLLFCNGDLFFVVFHTHENERLDAYTFSTSC